MSFIDVGQEKRPTPSFVRDGFAERRSREPQWSRKNWNSSSKNTKQARASFNGFGEQGINNEIVPDVAACSSGSSDERKVVAQREEEYATTMMREREEEMQKINEQVHTVNEIYKDLGHLVQSQQEQIDQLETNLETSKDNTRRGLEQLEEANGPSKWRRPFQGQTGQQEGNGRGDETSDENGSSKQRSFSFQLPEQFESLREDMGEVQKDISSIISDIVRKGKLLLLSCSAMGDVSNSPLI